MLGVIVIVVIIITLITIITINVYRRDEGNLNNFTQNGLDLLILGTLLFPFQVVSCLFHYYHPQPHPISMKL